MATAYSATNYSDPMPSYPGVGVSLCREFAFTASVALVINDTIKLCRIPCRGAEIVIEDWVLDIPDLDSGAALEFQLGDGTTADLFMAANTVGQSAGRVDSFAEGAAATVPSKVAAASADKIFTLKVSTAPAGGGTSVTPIRGYMRYHYVGIPTPLA